MPRLSRKETRNLATGLAFLGPNILGFLAFTVVPLVFSLFLAFSNWDLRRHNMFKDEPIAFTGVESFRRLLEPGGEFWFYLGNTVFLMMAIPFGIACSLGAAILLSRDLRGGRRNRVAVAAVAILVVSLLMVRAAAGPSGAEGQMLLLLSGVFSLVLLLGAFGGSTAYRTLFYLPHFTSGVAVFLLWKKLYTDAGPINTALAPSLDRLAQTVNRAPPPMVQAGLWAALGLALALLAFGLGRLRAFWRDGDLGTRAAFLPLAVLLVPAAIAWQWMPAPPRGEAQVVALDGRHALRLADHAPARRPGTEVEWRFGPEHPAVAAINQALTRPLPVAETVAERWPEVREVVEARVEDERQELLAQVERGRISGTQADAELMRRRQAFESEARRTLEAETASALRQAGAEAFEFEFRVLRETASPHPDHPRIQAILELHPPQLDEGMTAFPWGRQASFFATEAYQAGPDAGFQMVDAEQMPGYRFRILPSPSGHQIRELRLRFGVATQEDPEGEPVTEAYLLDDVVLRRAGEIGPLLELNFEDGSAPAPVGGAARRPAWLFLGLAGAAVVAYGGTTAACGREFSSRPGTGFGTAFLLALALMVAQFVLIGLGLVSWRLPDMAADGLNPPQWLTQYHWAKPSIMLMGLWGAIGSNNMLLYLAALTNVPQELYEAADIDGASRLQRFWHITWPQLAPTTFFIVVMSCIGGLQGGFEMARTMTQGGPAGATTVLSYYVYMEGFLTGRLGFASAIAWALFVMVFVLTMFNWRFGNRYVNE